MAVSSSTPFRRAQNTTSSFYGEKCAEVCDDGLLATTPGASVRHTTAHARIIFPSLERALPSDGRVSMITRLGTKVGETDEMRPSQRAPRWRLGPRRADPDVRRGGPRYAHERWCVHFGARFVRLPPISSVLPASRLLFPSPSRPRVPSSSPFSSSTAAAAATVAPR